MKKAVCAGLVMMWVGTGVGAQQVDCAEPMTQSDMTYCAGIAYQAADADLNLAWGMAMEMARSLDDGLDPNEVPAAQVLRDAQRKWIAFRDAACTAESFLVRFGSMQPMVELNCLERLTRTRTEDLRYFGEVN